MKKVRIARYVCFALSLAVMALIFRFSSQDGDSSGSLSDGVAQTLVNFLSNFISRAQAEGIAAYVRKYAHVALYALLALFVNLCAFTYPTGRAVKFAVPLGVCLAYALFDEFHQTFVAGRNGCFADVGIDAIGFAAVTVTANIVRLVLRKRRRR